MLTNVSLGVASHSFIEIESRVAVIVPGIISVETMILIIVLSLLSDASQLIFLSSVRVT